MESPTEAKQESHYIFAVIKFPGVFHLVLIQRDTALSTLTTDEHSQSCFS